jgi:hypothetical protein
MTSVTMRAILALAFAAIAGAPQDAFAADEAPPDVAPQAPAKRWYGWQTMAVDGLALGLTVTGLTSELPALTSVGLGTYALGPPVVHAAHGKVGTGLASFGIRVLAPVGGGALGFGVAGARAPWQALMRSAPSSSARSAP